jgi:hypothetical protein
MQHLIEFKRENPDSSGKLVETKQSCKHIYLNQIDKPFNISHKFTRVRPSRSPAKYTEFQPSTDLTDILQSSRSGHAL